MTQRTRLLAIILISILLTSLIVTVSWYFSHKQSTPDFFVGVEFAYSYSNDTDPKTIINDLKTLVNQVKNYTNLFVIGSIEVSLNKPLLTEACDYIYDTGLYFIVFFTNPMVYNHNPHEWILQATQKYGDKFLGVYRYDEPGGNQLDRGPSNFVVEAKDYDEAAEIFVDYLHVHIEDYLNSSPQTFTADYGLYWFDYKGGYTAIFTEFGFNHSRTIHTALCRGAATAQNKDWGAIMTWTYNQAPYINSPDELYNDMVLAYQNGAKHIIIFNYPKIGQYGILTDDHLDAIEQFWNYTKNNPHVHGANQGKTAYVLPSNYGFGFRHVQDTIWGLWQADELSEKIWNDTNLLAEKYGSNLDIVYDDPEYFNTLKNHYNHLIFWNETITE